MHKPTLINETTSYCRECDELHAARFLRENKRIIFVIDCPQRKDPFQISANADLFLDIRRQYETSVVSAQPQESSKHFYFIEITDSCNMECPICYAGANRNGRFFMDLDTVRVLGERIKSRGGRWITLTGGDPTMHPELAEIISLLRKDLKLSPLIATNGLRIAQDRDYLKHLKQAGLKKVQLQFDTFEDKTYELMRKRADASEKLGAVETIRSLGLRLGLVTTVCRYNIHELNKIIDYAASLTPDLNTLILQSMLPVGRFPRADIVQSREDIITQVSREGASYELAEKDFLPFPRFAPLGFQGHPDCEVSTFVAVDRKGCRSMSRQIDSSKLFRLMGSYNKAMPKWKARLMMMKCLYGASKSTRDFVDIFLRMLNLRTRWGSKKMFLITIVSFMHPDARDEERLGSCVSCNVTSRGFEGMCARNITGIPGQGHFHSEENR